MRAPERCAARARKQSLRAVACSGVTGIGRKGITLQRYKGLGE